jgi:hypothetical protein
MKWPTSKSNSLGQLPKGLMHDGEKGEPRRKWPVSTSGSTILRLLCKMFSMTLNDNSREHARMVSVKLNWLWKHSKGSGTTSDACHCPLTCWKQWRRLMTHCTINTEPKLKCRQKRLDTLCKQSEKKYSQMLMRRRHQQA